MSERIGDLIIISEESDGKCELCGKIDELRPYGGHGERICYECGMKNPEVTNRMMNRILFGDEDE